MPDLWGPSGETAPSGDLPGWRTRFVEDFDGGAFEAGGYPGHLAGRLLTYRDGTPDTAKVGRCDARVISVHDSLLDIRPQTLEGRPAGAAVGYEPGGSGSWAASGQVYGRWAMRWRTTRAQGYAVAGLLWPVSNHWAEGEIDWPEGSLASTLKGFIHTIGNPRMNAARTDTGLPTAGIWRTTVVEWVPNEVRCFLDDRLVMTSSQSPTTPMRWTVQVETAYGARPDPAVAGSVQIDWLAAWYHDDG